MCDSHFFDRTTVEVGIAEQVIDEVDGPKSVDVLLDRGIERDRRHAGVGAAPAPFGGGGPSNRH